jgi:hypothetical protein
MIVSSAKALAMTLVVCLRGRGVLDESVGSILKK